MKRRSLLFLLLMASACSKRKQAPVLPAQAGGGWRLRESKQEGNKTSGTYDGPGILHVEIEDAGSSAAALDRAQRFRPQPDMVFFYKGDYFVTVRWEKAERDALRSFVRDLENSFSAE
jgi:hypothetical protein